MEHNSIQQMYQEKKIENRQHILIHAILTYLYGLKKKQNCYDRFCIIGLHVMGNINNYLH